MPEFSLCSNPQCALPNNELTATDCVSCGESLLLNGQYRIVELLGQGGFGRTFKAIDEEHPQKKYCAIKQFLPQQVQAKEKVIELFEQEAKRLQTLGNHNQIPALYDYFQVGDRQYLVQEFIDGKNLAQELEELGKFTAADITKLLKELLPVLRIIHRRQVIHRDIKPENIIRRTPTKATEKSTLVLVDFGASKHATETTLGKTGTMIGSAAFIAPEQVRGKATFASDLYSLGVTCIHLLTAIAPFDLLDTGDNKWVWQDFVDKKFDPKLTRILNKLLEPATNRRYQQADDVLEDLHAPARAKKFPLKGAIAATLIIGLGVVGANALLTPIRQKLNPSVVVQNPDLPPFPAGLYATIDGNEQNLTLKNTEVDAKVSGNIAEVEVIQTFANPYDQPLEAIYKFPLPDDAAVDDMEIKIGNQTIRGVIKRSEEAEAIYEEAKEDGKTAALLEQERDNIFTQSLANILPGEEIEVTIRYSNSLKFEGEDYEFVFPMVVAPRYGDGNIQASSIGGATSAKALPKNRSGQDISVNLEIDAGVPIQNLTSPTHEIATQSLSGSTGISLANADEIPNKDLIVRYQVTGKETQATMLAQADQRGGHFATYLIPAVDYQKDEIVPKDVVFLMDTSGSQRGAAIRQSKELMRQFIQGLNPQDTFTIMDFSNTTKKLSRVPLDNTETNRQKALKYVNKISANGGTELMNGINEVMTFPEAEDGRLRTIVLLTDGLIGDDRTIIGMMEKQLKPGNRIFTFGVGYSTNHFLINRLAEVGRGESEILPESEDPKGVVAEFFEEINNPVLTNVEVSWVGGGDRPEIYPEHMPDLYDSQPLVLHGKKGDRQNGQLKVTGTIAGGKPYEKVFDVNFDQVQGNGAIAQLWGRAKIKEYMNDMYWMETTEGVNTVTNTALDYRLVSDYTSFVAVSDEVRVDSRAETLTQDVPLEKPEGMEFDALNAPTSAGSASTDDMAAESAIAPTPNTNQAPQAQTTPVPVAKNVAPSQQSNNGNSKDVPEPSHIIGNLLVLITLGFFFWKRRQQKKAKQSG
ncbi:serine/threonine protein kinase [[Leptolyngbya] sp. PCC 7376]|uniref:protein kinase domain-containing protein n=1 Tax=[Leptolyngbya] sp. PCC 7376 TaxID=111781 RepID=UPI00029F362F|nr:VIT domain-containing protein [[Leptolyngbya] sp. PCC 7376]AFY36482.1 serine/threonine protein kinase [[Leptolyngbya] sp. PCC 7376]